MRDKSQNSSIADKTSSVVYGVRTRNFEVDREAAESDRMCMRGLSTSFYRLVQRDNTVTLSRRVVMGGNKMSKAGGK